MALYFFIYYITEVKLHAYADDEQLHDSDTDPKLLDRRLTHQLNIANEWYRSNGMLVTPTKHQAMLIGNTDHVFPFPVHKSVTLFGITVDDRLCFDEQVSHIAFHTPKLKSNSMILWKEFLMLKGKAPLLQIIFAPSGQMIGRRRGTRTSPILCFVLKLTFLSTTSTFVLEALFSGRLLVYQRAPTVQLCWLIFSFIPSSTISRSKQWKRTLQKPSSSATPFDTSTSYSVSTMWTWNYISAIYPLELELKDTSTSSTQSVLSRHEYQD